MTFFDMAMIGIGGFVGAIIRYLMSTKMNRLSNIPVGTLLVNLVGALLIGVVFGLEVSRPMTLLLASGLAGALTTFSTLNKELIELWRKDRKKQCICYFLFTYGGGIMLVVLGYEVGRLL